MLDASAWPEINKIFAVTGARGSRQKGRSPNEYEGLAGLHGCGVAWSARDDPHRRIEVTRGEPAELLGASGQAAGGDAQRRATRRPPPPPRDHTPDPLSVFMEKRL